MQRPSVIVLNAMMDTKNVEEKEESAMRARTSPVVVRTHQQQQQQQQRQQQHDNDLGAIASDQAVKKSGGTVLSSPNKIPLRLKRVRPYMDQMVLVVVIAAWYSVGALAIVTTKLLLTTWRVPPLLLTAQQFFLASTILRTVLAFGKGAQPWPVDKTTRLNLDFVMAGLFNSMDFLASNSAFSASAASFVETIKASEPITTTAVALVWQVDRLGLHESKCLVLLVAGVFLSTIGNAAAPAFTKRTDEEAVIALEHSTRTAVTVMSANLCFAFRALSQKRYRTSRPSSDQLNDINLLCRMLQVGALILLPALLWIHGDKLIHAVAASSAEKQIHYAGLTLLNATSFAVYNWASCYVLSHVSVLHHSSLNCLRRMFVTIATSIFFGVKITLAGGTGIAMSFAGFLSFTHYRIQRRNEEQELKPKDSNV